ncbi:uncharacterized protein J3D65DRAFT_623753 [Phyllosticta citribraziliensis]|uniref:Uncharacterized protein n=1 Tax=Phyllosticta citribraziliensis TaxID=989973 RepID=A0ABR1LP00_9PEZI
MATKHVSILDLDPVLYGRYITPPPLDADGIPKYTDDCLADLLTEAYRLQILKEMPQNKGYAGDVSDRTHIRFFISFYDADLSFYNKRVRDRWHDLHSCRPAGAELSVQIAAFREGTRDFYRAICADESYFLVSEYSDTQRRRCGRSWQVNNDRGARPEVTGSSGDEEEVVKIPRREYDALVEDLNNLQHALDKTQQKLRMFAPV